MDRRAALQVCAFFAVAFFTAGLAVITQSYVLATIFLVVGLGFGGMTAYFYRQHRKYQVYVMNSLATFMREASALRQRCADENQPPPENEANQWAQKTEDFLRQHLGESYVVRFHSDAGLPMAASSISSLEHRNLWGAMHRSMARLAEFLGELGSTRD